MVNFNLFLSIFLYGFHNYVSLFLSLKALALKESDSLMELVDERLGSEFNTEEVMVLINIALQCASVSPTTRPSMSSVVSMLEGKAVIQELDSDPSDLSDKMEPEEIKLDQPHSHVTNTDHRQVQSMSVHESWTASSTATADLYPVDFEVEYWKSRDQRRGE